jgi:hypothetical protein
MTKPPSTNQPKMIIPAAEPLAAHEEAAVRIAGLRRKGVHCHLQQGTEGPGPSLEIVPDPPGRHQQPLPRAASRR